MQNSIVAQGVYTKFENGKFSIVNVRNLSKGCKKIKKYIDKAKGSSNGGVL
ncbi:hypothetical protein [Clostridium frigidicarnis]|uniref:Uncharacterized protein n=1 Tax=Clostridium frigidicarnis TaxID=84698 RepID=A0A1I0Z8R4_9CLOT|nr:hypothetical protein [Clostridium frigidicarnis]SFB21737.1 hypothetical protein SAMN04488528_101835 [Clostridium frigidicarnis]